MSYDIYMVEPSTGKRAKLQNRHFYKGGTFELYGTVELWVNITYNYSPFYKEAIDKEDGIRFIYGKTGKEVLPIINKAIDELGTDKSEDYWEPTRGNAGHALLALKFFCEVLPDGIFKGD